MMRNIFACVVELVVDVVDRMLIALYAGEPFDFDDEHGD